MSKFRNYSNYEIYPDGKIWSYKYKKFLKPNTVKGGYKQVGLTDNEGKRKMYYVHRVVYEAVTGEQIPEGMQVNHISEAKDENFVENLDIVSPKQNSNWGSRNERIGKALKGIIPKANPPKQVGAFKNGELVMVFPSTREASRQGFNEGNVAASCRNCYNRPGNNVYKGYEWRYL